jgi:hypothetical protein
MVFFQQFDQIAREFFRQGRVTVGNMRNKVDQIAQTDDARVVRCAGRLAEQLEDGLVLRELPDEVVAVRGRVVFDFVLQIGQVGVDFLQCSDFALHRGGEVQCECNACETEAGD